MTFNILSCFLVIFISLIVYATIFTLAESRWILRVKDEDKGIIMGLAISGTLIFFMWLMSWQYWWR